MCPLQLAEVDLFQIFCPIKPNIIQDLRQPFIPPFLPTKHSALVRGVNMESLNLKLANALTILLMVITVFVSIGATTAQPAPAPGPASSAFGIMDETDGPAPGPTSDTATLFVPLVISAAASIFAYMF